MAGSTPTVLNTRRVTELKNVSASSASGRCVGPECMLGLHGGPDRSLHYGIFEDVVHVRHRRIHVGLVELQPLGGIGLGAGPVAPLEPARGPGG